VSTPKIENIIESVRAAPDIPEQQKKDLIDKLKAVPSFPNRRVDLSASRTFSNVPLLEILSTVNRYTNYVDELQHWQQRYHHRRPSEPTIFAGVIGIGFQSEKQDRLSIANRRIFREAASFECLGRMCFDIVCWAR
jgi:hypothetical protein